MLYKKNLVIILDTHILKDIIDDYNSNNLIEVLKNWLTYVIQNMKLVPRGKRIGIVASTEVLGEYKNRLARSGHKNIAKTISDIFDQGTSRKYPIDKEKGVYLSIGKIHPDKNRKRVMRDKYDEKFLELINGVLKLRKWREHFVIVATSDTPTKQDLETELNAVERVSVEGSILDLEETVKC